jgi:hypothetical protein
MTTKTARGGRDILELGCLTLLPFALTVLLGDVRSHAAEGQSRPERKLVAHWKLTGDYRDSSGNGNHGRNQGVQFATAARPQAAEFDGRASWIEVPPSPSLRLGTNDFTIAAWVRVPEKDREDDSYGDLLSQFDPALRRGFNFRITHHTGVTTSQPNTRNVHFGMDDGQGEAHWTDHGRPGNAILIFALAAFDGALYAGTCEPGKDQSGRVYRFAGGTNWMDCGSPHPCNSVSALAEFNGQLYAGVSKYRLAGSSLPESENPHPGGKVYRYAGGTSWEDCGQLPDTEAVGGLVVYRGRLYASSLYRPAGFFRYEGGRRWTALPVPFGKRVEAMSIHDGQLFASSYDAGHVFRYDGTNWVDCGQVGPPENTQTYSFAVYEGRLHVGTWNTGRVYRYGGDNIWKDMGRLGQELEVMGMMVHNGKLYAGSLPLAEVYRFDGPENWTRLVQLDTTPDVKYRRAWTMAEFQGRLFCGTLPSGRVWSFEAGRNVTCDRALTPGWHHLAAVRGGRQLLLYVDGRPAAASTKFDPAQYDLSLDQPWKLGFGQTDYFRGSLRDVRIYGYALNRREVRRLAW